MNQRTEYFILCLVIIFLFGVFVVLCVVYGEHITSTAKEIIIFVSGVLAGFLSPQLFANKYPIKEVNEESECPGGEKIGR